MFWNTAHVCVLVCTLGWLHWSLWLVHYRTYQDIAGLFFIPDMNLSGKLSATETKYFTLTVTVWLYAVKQNGAFSSFTKLTKILWPVCALVLLEMGQLFLASGLKCDSNQQCQAVCPEVPTIPEWLGFCGCVPDLIFLSFYSESKEAQEMFIMP